MSKIIVYGFENRLWFGRPTFASWVSSFFVPDRLLKIKPFKGFEEYAHPAGKCVRISPQFVKVTNFGFCSDPLTAVMVAEKEKEKFNEG